MAKKRFGVNNDTAPKSGEDTLAWLGEPQEKQREFCRAKERYVAYGGAKYAGKSWVVQYKAIGGCMKYPGLKVLILRKHYPDLEDNHIRPIIRLVPPQYAQYNGTAHVLTFWNGSIIRFGHWTGDESEDEYNGQAYDWIFMDEATQFVERTFNFLDGCVRGANAYEKHLFVTCNPGGVGHRWVKRLFVDGDYHTNCENPEENENPKDYKFIFATVEDNDKAFGDEAMRKNNPEQWEEERRKYLAALSKMGSAYRFGDWAIIKGAYFPEFSLAQHVRKSFVIPQHWPRYRSLDYGYDGLAIYWWAVDEDGRSWCYREATDKNLIAQDVANKIKSLTLPNEKIITTYIPPDLWSRQKDSGRSTAEILMNNEISISKSVNNREQGHMVMRSMLASAPLKDPYVKKMYGNKSPDVLPMLMFFSVCEHIISDIQDIQADENNPNDCAKQPHDVTHSVDGVRYFAIMRTMTADTPHAEVYPDELMDDYADNYEEVMCGGVATAQYIGYGGR